MFMKYGMEGEDGVFTIKGESFRGKKLETVALQTSRVKAPDSSEKPTP